MMNKLISQVQSKLTSDKSKSVLKTIAVFAFFFIVALLQMLKKLEDADELWNYNFAINVLNGKLPYRDFNIVQTPLSPYISALFLAIFGNSLVSFRIASTTLMALTFTTFFKICKKVSKYSAISFFTTAFVFLMCFYIWIYNYNNLILFLVLVIMYLETVLHHSESDRPVMPFVIALLYGILPLIKQNTGAVLLLYFLAKTVYCLFKNKNSRKMHILYTVTALIPGIVFVVVMLLLGIFDDFIDYAIKGVGTFSHRTYIWDSRTEVSVWVCLAFILFTIVFSVICILKNKSSIDAKLHAKMLLLSFFAGTVAFPLSDFIHMIVAFLPYVICFLCCFKLKKPSAAENFVYVFASILMLSVLAYNTVNEVKKLEKSNLKHFENIPVDNVVEEGVTLMNKYIPEMNSRGDDVIIADSSAVLFTIPLDKYTKDFDMLLVGNLGTKSVEELLSEHKGSVFLVSREIRGDNIQEHLELNSYIKENYTKIDEILYFDVYRECE